MATVFVKKEDFSFPHLDPLNRKNARNRRKNRKNIVLNERHHHLNQIVKAAAAAVTIAVTVPAKKKLNEKSKKSIKKAKDVIDTKLMKDHQNRVALMVTMMTMLKYCMNRLKCIMLAVAMKKDIVKQLDVPMKGNDHAIHQAMIVWNLNQNGTVQTMTMKEKGKLSHIDYPYRMDLNFFFFIIFVIIDWKVHLVVLDGMLSKFFLFSLHVDFETLLG